MPDSLHIWALGSGSSGNSIVISNGSSSIMVDAGFSCREMKSRMARLAPEPAPLAATLITHDHTDHVRGCRVFCDELDIPAAVSLRTADFLRPKNLLPRKCFYFEPGSRFDIADYPNANAYYENEITLPLHTVLSDEDVDYVIENYTDIIKEYLNK